MLYRSYYQLWHSVGQTHGAFLGDSLPFFYAKFALAAGLGNSFSFFALNLVFMRQARFYF
jgi:hypothetical protein